MKMNYKKVVLAGLLTLGLSGCVGVNPAGGYDITIPMNMVNSTVQSQFPQTQNTKYGKLLISTPNILGKANKNQLGVGSGFTFSNSLIPGGVKGKVSLSSGVRFDPATKGLYLASPMVDDIKFQKFALSNYLTPSMRSTIGKLIAATLAKKPIYSLSSTPGAAFVRGVGVKDGNIVVNLGM